MFHLINWADPLSKYLYPRRYRTRRTLRLIDAYTIRGV